MANTYTGAPRIPVKLESFTLPCPVCSTTATLYRVPVSQEGYIDSQGLVMWNGSCRDGHKLHFETDTKEQTK